MERKQPRSTKKIEGKDESVKNGIRTADNEVCTYSAEAEPVVVGNSEARKLSVTSVNESMMRWAALWSCPVKQS